MGNCAYRGLVSHCISRGVVRIVKEGFIVYICISNCLSSRKRVMAVGDLPHAW